MYSNDEIKKIYNSLTKNTQDICQIIFDNGFKEKFLLNKDLNVILVFYHLIAIIYIIIKKQTDINNAELTSKKLIYETLIRVSEDYETILLDSASNIITKYNAYYRESQRESNDSNVNFSEEIAKGICKIFDNDELYFQKEKNIVLIDKLKQYVDVFIKKFNL